MSPHRPRLLTLLLFAFVVVVASVTAHVFKSILLRLIRFYADRADPTTASAERPAR